MDVSNGLRALGLETGGREEEKIRRFIAEIDLWNPRYKLVSAGDDLLVRHVLDSLAGMDVLRLFSPSRLADVGSGAGLPGIPLAVWMPNTEFFLVERSGRRAGFLRHTATLLGLRNIRVIQSPVEEIPPPEKGYDLITFRAWSAMDGALLSTLGPLLSSDGLIAAYKGRLHTAAAEIQKVSGHLQRSEIKSLSVPGLEQERCLVLMWLNS